MKKIIIAFDGIQFSEAAFSFASRLNEINPVLLTGIFLPQIDYANLWGFAGAMSGVIYSPEVEEKETELIKKNIAHFEHLCSSNGIEYRVHSDLLGFVLPELKKETRFADLLILGSEKFFENFRVGHSNEYLKEALHQAECPVLVVPETFEFPNSIILAYDGSESSVYAIKQFAQVLPELCQSRTILVNAGKENEPIPDQIYIEELAARHFGDLTLFKLEADPREYFASFLLENKNPLLVAGSYARSGLFRKSFVADIIHEHATPVFIAHK